MNLYKTTDNNGKTKWSGSLADAGKDRKALKSEGAKDVGTETIEVPTNKPGLLDWLNTNVK